MVQIIDGARHHLKVACRCECGNEKRVYVESLVYGTSRSCGCLRNERIRETPTTWKTHGLTGHPLFKTWRAMIRRCFDPRDKSYINYGGRGITVCEQWQGPEGAKRFVADMGERPSGQTLERIDNDGDYEPSNCRWATRAEQTKNRRRQVPGARRLLAENQSLRRDITALEAENAQLRRRIGELMPVQFGG